LTQETGGVKFWEGTHPAREKLAALRRERELLENEMSDITLGEGEYEKCTDGVDYRYMRSVAIQRIDKEIASLQKQLFKVV
jgi:hypothetical protein